jgi:hypothetical protein
MTRYAPPKHHSEVQITASSNLGRCLGNSPRRRSGTFNKMTRGPSSRGVTGVGNIQNFSSHSHSTSPLSPSWPPYHPTTPASCGLDDQLIKPVQQNGRDAEDWKLAEQIAAYVLGTPEVCGRMKCKPLHAPIPPTVPSVLTRLDQLKLRRLDQAISLPMLF